MSSKRLQVYETGNFMSITLRWYSPMAFFLLFFSIIWNGFLVVWYSIALAEGVFAMALFPVLHVAAGVFLAYYTACLFFNKTYIDIDPNLLTVVNKPLPWWKGNKRINTPDIAQLYVKETKSSGKNGTSYTYGLRAKMVDGQDIQVFKLDTMSSQEVLALEETLERFMGLPDTPVRGEFGKSVASEPKGFIQAPRRHMTHFSDPVLTTVFRTSTGDEVFLRGEDLHVISITQYDWHDGNTDKLLQALNPKNEDRLIFLEQKGARLQAAEEWELKLFETDMARFSADAPPLSIMTDSRKYLLAHTKTGKCFVPNQLAGLDVQQWQYIAHDQQHYIRVLQFGQTITLFKGKLLGASDFGQTLDLNNPPRRDYEPRAQSWSEDDLV